MSTWVHSVMANSSWKRDEQLKTDLEQYARQNLKRLEIFDFRDFPEYAWSTATLDRRLDIWINKDTFILQHQ